MKKPTHTCTPGVQVRFIILSLIVCLLIFAGGFLYTRFKPPLKTPIVYPSKIELRLTIDDYLQNQQYDKARY